MMKFLLRAEGLALLLLSLFFYQWLNFDWRLFAILILAPDLGMIGYIIGPRVGAVTYNVLHLYLLPAALIAYGIIYSYLPAVAWGLIICAHISADRLLGFGLKYPSSFKNTHLQSI